VPIIHLRKSIDGVPESATLAINEKSAELVAQGRDIIRFGLGQSPFPVPGAVVESLRQHAAEKDYLPVQGLAPLRESVAAWHERHSGFSTTAADIVVGPGSKELLYQVQLALDAELVLPSPCWVSYAPQARIARSPVAVLETTWEDRWRLDPERLAHHCAKETGRCRILLLNYPCNPTGLTYTHTELEALAAVAAEHGVIIAADEIYGPLQHAGHHRSIAGWYPEGTIVTGGLSKWCGAGGWRLGTAAFPSGLKEVRKAVQAVASETFTSVSAPIQYAAITAFEGSEAIDDYLARCRRLLSALGDQCVEILRASGLRVHDPEGGFYLLLDLRPLAEPLAARGITTGAQAADRLLEETGVALLPGEEFNRPKGELSLRMAYVAFDGAAALAACENLPANAPLDTAFLERTCGPTLEGVRRIRDWLTGD